MTGCTPGGRNPEMLSTAIREPAYTRFRIVELHGPTYLGVAMCADHAGE